MHTADFQVTKREYFWQRADFSKCQTSVLYVLGLRRVGSKRALCFVLCCFYFFFSCNRVRDKLRPPFSIHPARPRSLRHSRFIQQVNNSPQKILSEVGLLPPCVKLCFFLFIFHSAACFAIINGQNDHRNALWKRARCCCSCRTTSPRERLALPQTAGGPEVNAADDLRLRS